jgi:hypothetical protein
VSRGECRQDSTAGLASAAPLQEPNQNVLNRASARGKNSVAFRTALCRFWPQLTHLTPNPSVAYRRYVDILRVSRLTAFFDLREVLADLRNSRGSQAGQVVNPFSPFPYE